MKFTLLADQPSLPGFTGEFGLSLLIGYNDEKFLFDTGADNAFLLNAAKLGVTIDRLPVILSHGHYDHSGGLQYLSPSGVWCAANADCGHYSYHDDGTIHHIYMPFAAQAVLRETAVFHPGGFTEIADGLYLTGEIPRNSGEDCGGNFFHDEQCTIPDEVPDEQSLLTSSGVLVTGCCHSGIINTVEFCRLMHPEIKIRAIVGGLHLRRADEYRLHRTAEYLAESGIEQLHLLHCTGENAVEYLKNHLPKCKIYTPATGSTWEI